MGSQLNLSELILALISFSYFTKEIRTIDRTIQPPAVTKSISHTIEIADSVTFRPKTAHVFEGS